MRDFTLESLEEGLYLEMAREWAKKRSLYIEHSFDLTPDRRQIGVFTDRLISVFTITAMGADCYRVDITSPPRSCLDLISSAAGSILNSLFYDLGAFRVIASVPSVNGHRHEGSRRLCEGWGAIHYGQVPEEIIDGRTYGATIYQIRRDMWLKSEAA